MLNWYCYRLPYSDTIIAGGSDSIIYDIHEESFVIAPFNQKSGDTFSIPTQHRFEFQNFSTFARFVKNGDIQGIMRIANGSECKYPLPIHSTTQEEHSAEVKSFIGHHRRRGEGKTIAARVLRTERSTELIEIFKHLADKYTSAYIFAFGTEKTGTWIGATPELLLSHKDCEYSTMALAGTRKVDTEGEWDSKNLHEQGLVAQFIVGELQHAGLEVKCGKQETRKAGPVEHLCTSIRGVLKNNQKSNIELLKQLVRTLSPTPALCGDIREESMQLIEEHEKFDRGFYGGFMGEIDKNGEGELFVNLRSARITESDIYMFAGGGITADSEPEPEWEETERKLNTIRTVLDQKYD